MDSRNVCETDMCRIETKKSYADTVDQNPTGRLQYAFLCHAQVYNEKTTTSWRHFHIINRCLDFMGKCLHLSVYNAMSWCSLWKRKLMQLRCTWSDRLQISDIWPLSHPGVIDVPLFSDSHGTTTWQQEVASRGKLCPILARFSSCNLSFKYWIMTRV